MSSAGARGLAAMLAARSVAVVGASSRAGSPGNQMMRQLITGGFEGDIWAVNPRYTEVEGRSCYGSLAELPGEIDLVLLGVANRLLEDQLRAAANASARSAVIFASGHDEPDSVPGLLGRLSRIASEAGMSICGGNCMGFVNFERKLRALAFEEREDMAAGHITWISHSGSAFTALLHNDRGLTFNLAVSAGQELTTTVADYIAYAAAQPSTGLIALFLETVRDPDGFRDALSAASARNIPIVALKVGREAAAKRLVTAHSGALAGDDAVHQAVFDAHGVARVSSLNEMADTLELLSAGRRARPGGLAAIHDSGGERAHLVDAAAGAGVPFASISEATAQRLEAVLEPGLPAVNPLDAWGTGNDYEAIYLECMRALTSDPEVAALAFVVDLAGEDLERGYVAVAEQVHAETSLPVAVLCNLASGIDQRAAARLREGGIPVLEDTLYGLRAFRHLFGLRDFLPAPASLERVVPHPVRARWRRRLGRTDAWSEAEALALLRDYRIPTAPTEVATTPEEAHAAAARLSFPVALKVSGVAHKSDVDGVLLDLRDGDEVRGAFESLSPRSTAALVVQRMAPPGVEMALGLVHDEQFGPVVIVAAGGTQIELLADRAVGLPPIDAARAKGMVDALRSRPVLDGFRGGPPADVGALASAVTALSELALDLGDLIEALDVNPFIVGPRGCTAVDALVVPRNR
jgi:acetate---CoA ligase (ADP-forming)